MRFVDSNYIQAMLVIRFQRVGRKNDPAFLIVVTEKRSKPKSGELEILGSFHPKTKATILKAERISHWLSRGAKPSPRAHNLLVSRGIIRAKKIHVSKRFDAAPAAAPGESEASAAAPPPAEPGASASAASWRRGGEPVQCF